MDTCGILLPSGRPPLTAYAEGFGECLLLKIKGHEKHLCQLPGGQYIAWESALDCGCEEWPDCDCYDYKELSSAEAFEILNAQIR